MPLLRRKYAAKSKLIRRKRLARPGLVRRKVKSSFGRGGGFVLKRRIDLTTMYNNASLSAGTIGVKQGGAAGSTWLSFGTPVLADGCVAGNAGTAFYDIPFSMNFKLSDITSSTDVTSIADKYKLGLVSIKVLTNGQAPSYLSGGPAPFIEYVYDHDDAVVPTIASLTQKMGLRTKNFGMNGKCNLHVRPVPTTEVYSGGAAAASGVPRRAIWLNSSDNAVPHYGVKGVIRNFGCSSTVNVASVMSFDANVTIIAKDLQ